MEVKYFVFVFCVQFIVLPSITEVHLQEFHEKETIEGNNDRGCAYVHCEGNDVCVYRKFRCKEPPCPSMLYCAKSRTESIRGPSTCETVHCSTGHVCMLKVRRCRWDDKCEQQIARCVSRKEYYEGPASCAGFKCPQGNRCILRESFCANPPCKLLKSCAKNKEVHSWSGKCRTLGCPSEYECFLRRPTSNCTNPPCRHTPDCIMTKEDEITNEHCRGWICPQMQTCFAEIVGFCETDDCDVKRTCQEVPVVATNDSSSSFSRRSLKKNDVQRNETEVPEEESVEAEVEGTKTPYSWLNYSNSKTELDRIESWIKNMDEQQGHKLFQDRLQSIKDTLGSDAYRGRLEEILSLTEEEFRKWLRALLDRLDAEGQLSLGQKRSSALTENPYPAHHTVPPMVENTHRHPMKDTEDMSSSSAPNHDSELGNVKGIISRNLDESREPTNFSSSNGLEEWTNMPLTKEKILSLCTEFLENPEQKLLAETTSDDKDSAVISEDQGLHYFNALLVYLLEKLDDSLQLSATKSTPMDIGSQQIEDHRQSNAPEASQNQLNNEISKWYLTRHLKNNEDSHPQNKNDEGNVNESSFNKDNIENSKQDLEEKCSIFLQKLGSIRFSNDFDESEDTNSELSLEETTDKTNAVMNLNLFVEQNKDSPLHFVQTSQKSEQNTDENSAQNFFAYDNRFGATNVFPDELPTSRIESFGTHVEYNPNHFNGEGGLYFFQNQTNSITSSPQKIELNK